MKQIFRNSWFQVIFSGIIIGALLIFIDTTFNFFRPGKKINAKMYNGAVQADAEEMYFTEMKILQTKFDFGLVKEGDTVAHKFIIKNSGKEPLMIFKTKGSCDCIKAFHPETAIMPGNAGEVGVYFKTVGRKGPQVRTVTLHTNTEPSETTLTLTGNVE